MGTAHISCREYGLPRPAMLLLVYPIITTKVTYDDNREWFFVAMFGYGYTQRTLDHYEVDTHVDRDYLPVYLKQCRDDKAILVTNAERMLDALSRADIPHQVELPAVGHGFGVGREFWQRDG